MSLSGLRGLSVRWAGVVALLGVGLGGAAARADVILGDPADAGVFRASPPNPADGGGGVGSTGDAVIGVGNGNNSYSNLVYVFQLPDLGARPDPFASADFTAFLSGREGIFGGVEGIDLYGLGARDASTVLGSDFFFGSPSDATDATLLQNDFYVVPDNDAAIPQGSSASTNAGGDAALLAYLNGAYAGGAGVGRYVFLRLSPDRAVSIFHSARFYTANQSGTALDPLITYTATPIPEPAGAALLAGGVAGLLARRRVR